MEQTFIIPGWYESRFDLKPKPQENRAQRKDLKLTSLAGSGNHKTSTDHNPNPKRFRIVEKLLLKHKTYRLKFSSVIWRVFRF